VSRQRSNTQSIDAPDLDPLSNSGALAIPGGGKSFLWDGFSKTSPASMQSGVEPHIVPALGPLLEIERLKLLRRRPAEQLRHGQVGVAGERHGFHRQGIEVRRLRE
jgi:hypothetical protein